jgi:Uma2 family endonuclease
LTAVASTTLAPPRPATTRRFAAAEVTPEQNHIVFEDASWSLYERLLRENVGRPIRMAYDDGRLEIMSPLPEHEIGKRAIGRLIERLTREAPAPAARPSEAVRWPPVAMAS